MKHVIAVFVVFLLIGCATISIESRKHPEYDEQLRKTLVLIDVPDIDWYVWEYPDPEGVSRGEVKLSLGEYLGYKIEQKIAETGIEVESFVPSGLELEDDFRDTFASFDPKIVMEVKLAEVMVTTSYGSSSYSGNFNVRLFDVSLDRDVWRAKTNRVAFTEYRLDRMIDQLLITMQNDGILATFTPVE